MVYTNHPPCGAMRGFGAPQVCFAHEAQMDKIAARLGVDPVERRLANALRTGTLGPCSAAFCTPGLIMAAHELLHRVTDPSGDEIREALAGNLCRCTGYQKILDAVHLAARR